MLESTASPPLRPIIQLLEWVTAVATGLGVIAGAVFLIPAVTAIVASFFVDEIAAEVERVHYPADPPGRPLSLPRALLEGGQGALIAVLVYLCAIPFLLLAPLGFLIFFLATAYVQGRIYFELAAMRFHAPADAKRLRKLHQGTVFVAGCWIAAFLSIPVVSLATPLFAIALMVHVYKRRTLRPSLIAARP